MVIRPEPIPGTLGGKPIPASGTNSPWVNIRTEGRITCARIDSDSETWPVLEGSVTFRFAEREAEAPAGVTDFVSAGAAHTYQEADGPSGSLVMMSLRLKEMVSGLHAASLAGQPDIMLAHDSELWNRIGG